MLVVVVLSCSTFSVVPAIAQDAPVASIPARSAAPSEVSDPGHRVTRAALTALTGTGTTIVTAGALAVTFVAMGCLLPDDGPSNVACVAPTLVALALHPLLIWGMGNALDGDGSLWATYLGAVVGWIGAGLALSELDADSTGATLLFVSLPSLVATLGYELTSSDRAPPPVQPGAIGATVAATADSASLVAYGSF